MEITNDYIEFRKAVKNSLISLFSLPQENVPWVKKSVLSKQPIAFYNRCKMFFDESSLPPNCADVTDLSNKFILYGIYCNGKFYVGSTADFGERMATHIKDSKKNKAIQQLYSDMVKTGVCISFIFGIIENEKDLHKIEHTIIKECKNYSINKACGFDKNAVKFITESIVDSKEYAQKFCYNIID